jgi:hypothetical protein
MCVYIICFFLVHVKYLLLCFFFLFFRRVIYERQSRCISILGCGVILYGAKACDRILRVFGVSICSTQLVFVPFTIYNCCWSISNQWIKPCFSIVFNTLFGRVWNTGWLLLQGFFLVLSTDSLHQWRYVLCCVQSCCGLIPAKVQSIMLCNFYCIVLQAYSIEVCRPEQQALGISVVSSTLHISI